MGTYRVTIQGKLSSTWKVQAENEEAAAEAVLHGEGDWVEDSWDEDPEVSQTVAQE